MSPLESISFVAVGAGTPEDPRLADWKLASGLPLIGLLVEQHIVGHNAAESPGHWKRWLLYQMYFPPPTRARLTACQSHSATVPHQVLVGRVQLSAVQDRGGMGKRHQHDNLDGNHIRASDTNQGNHAKG